MVAIVHRARTERIVNVINAKNAFFRANERSKGEGKGKKEEGKGKLEVKLWQKRKKNRNAPARIEPPSRQDYSDITSQQHHLSQWLNGRASASFAGVPGSIPVWAFAFFSVSSKIFTSNFPFPFSFPFLFLSLSLSLRPFVCAKNAFFAFIPINYSFSPCVMHNGDRDGSPERSASCGHWMIPASSFAIVSVSAKASLPISLSLSPFPFSCPFLFLSLSLSLRPFVCAKKRILRIYPISYLKT